MTKKSEGRVVNYADELFEEWRSDSEKSRGKKFLRRDFSYGEAQRRKSEERVVFPTRTNFFEQQRSQTEKIAAKSSLKTTQKKK